MSLAAIEVDARPVAVVRIGLGLATVLNAFEMYALLDGIAAGKVALPVLSWVPAPTELTAMLYLWLAVGAGALLVLGLRTSLAATVTTAANLWLFVWDQQTYSSHRLLAMLMVVYLIWARSDATWAYRSRGRAATTVPWWPQLLMLTQLSTCYFFAAVTKLNPVFLAGALQSWIRVPLPTLVLLLLTVGTVLTELYLAFGLWHQATRRLAVLLGVCLHVSIVSMMASQTLPLLSFALTCVPLYVLFMTRPSLRNVAPATVGKFGSSALHVAQ